MILLFDVGNTHTHLGLATRQRVVRQAQIPTPCWFSDQAERLVRRFVGRHPLVGATLCSVVPQTTPLVRRAVWERWSLTLLELNHRNLAGLGLDYPRPETIGPDRLANAVAARHFYGQPVIVIDFGTAVTFDVVNRQGEYIGGIIAPGLSAMTDYLHEKTALLPRIRVRETRRVIGRNTAEAMVIGAVHGYRGLIRELLAELRRELRTPRLPVVATGGYARLIAAKLPQIAAVRPSLTLEGLRLVWLARGATATAATE
ncbi:MAG: type III pantothenate kinase [Verrucomicrobia bacterium]|nr:type III pantothenate kinase [Verrucomicrobiota bacterium]